jgi:hypothetical protein
MMSLLPNKEVSCKLSVVRKTSEWWVVSCERTNK